jgi:hypothetical protein
VCLSCVGVVDQSTELCISRAGLLVESLLQLQTSAMCTAQACSAGGETQSLTTATVGHDRDMGRVGKIAMVWAADVRVPCHKLRWCVAVLLVWQGQGTEVMYQLCRAVCGVLHWQLQISAV